MIAVAVALALLAPAPWVPDPAWDLDALCAHPRLAPLYPEACAAREPEPVAGEPQQNAWTVWDSLARCESGGDWSINTGNGYSGGVQFAPATWRAWRAPDDPPFAWQASRERQIVAATRLRDAVDGYRPWPACARRLGLRR